MQGMEEPAQDSGQVVWGHHSSALPELAEKQAPPDPYITVHPSLGMSVSAE